MSTETNVQEIARRLRNYFAQHPNAEDSLDGISRWWLADFGTRRDIQAALEFLAAQGEVQTKESPRGVVYRATKGRRIT